MFTCVSVYNACIDVCLHVAMYIMHECIVCLHVAMYIMHECNCVFTCVSVYNTRM